MRHRTSAALAGLFLLTAALASAADPPIPQDPKRQAQHYADSLAWNRRTLGGAYDKVGKKDPRWDKPARAALELAAGFFAGQINPRPRLEDVYTAARQAVDAGCDDPLLLYLYARSSFVPNYPGKGEAERRYAAAAKALESSAYPAIRRANALCKAGLEKAVQKGLSAEARAEAARLLDAALALVPQGLKDEERNATAQGLWLDLPIDVIEGHRQLTGDRQAAFERVDAVLARHPELKVLRLKVKGDFLIHWAWDARGIGLANTVTPEGFKKFEERLTEARKALTEAWEADPGDPFPATRLLTAERGVGGDRKEMEKWFGRAMQANGNNRRACAAKLDWLDPKWHGSMEEMMAFGRACRETKNWRAGITTLAIEAHRRAMQHQPEGQRRDYFKAEGIWQEVREVYEEYLRHYPDDHAERSRYAAYCYLCGQHAESHRQFQTLGDNLIAFPTYFPTKWMRQVRDYVAGQAKKAAGKPPE